MGRNVFAALAVVMLAAVCLASPTGDEGIGQSPQTDLQEPQGTCAVEEVEADLSVDAQVSTPASSGQVLHCLLDFCKKTGVRCFLIGPKVLPNGDECCEYECSSDPTCDVHGVHRPDNACPGT